jgi:hypothetical protein
MKAELVDGNEDRELRDAVVSLRLSLSPHLDIEITLKPNAVYGFLITLPDIDLESQRRVIVCHCIP